MRHSIGIMCACVALTCCLCFGQSPLDGVMAGVSPGAKPGEFTVSCTVSPPFMPRTILVRRPYSGEEVSRQTKMLPDGTRIVQPVLSAIRYRDGSGRVRTERRPLHPVGMVPVIDPPIVPEIVDPVAGFVYYLDTTNRVAHRAVLSPDSFRIIAAPLVQYYPATTKREKDSIMTSEPLGTAIVNGIEAQGRRTTTTYAVDTLGDDSPLVSTVEIWTSPELGLIVRSKSTDPRTGEFTNEVTNIRRGEPDRALFQVPPDYKIVDEPKVPFTFTISTVSRTEP